MSTAEGNGIGGKTKGSSRISGTLMWFALVGRQTSAI